MCEEKRGVSTLTYLLVLDRPYVPLTSGVTFTAEDKVVFPPFPEHIVRELKKLGALGTGLQINSNVSLILEGNGSPKFSGLGSGSDNSGFDIQ